MRKTVELLIHYALLCPNCHSQTDNLAGRNIRRITDKRP
jgi:hypothetical protein